MLNLLRGATTVEYPVCEYPNSAGYLISHEIFDLPEDTRKQFRAMLFGPNSLNMKSRVETHFLSTFLWTETYVCSNTTTETTLP